MKRIKEYIKNNGGTICVLLALVLFLISLLLNTSSKDTEATARRLSARIEKRMAILDKYIGIALESDRDQWLNLEGLPEDMVIYRYVYDTLQCWTNQFTISNDNIGSRLVFQKLGNQKMSLSSPLSDVTQEAQYMNIGPKWYIVKCVADGIDCRVIGGLEIKNSLIDNVLKSDNGTNRRLRLDSKYSIVPIIESGGAAVILEGRPLMKVICETSADTPFIANSILRWLALLLTVLSAILYLWRHRSIGTYRITLLLIVLAAGIAYIWGLQMQDVTSFFSPTIYADGKYLYSFGALMIVNLGITLGILSGYIVRSKFIERASERHRTAAFLLHGSAIILLFTFVVIWVVISLKSLILNSNIYLELYLWNRMSWFTILVYMSYSGLMLALLLLIQMFEPIVHFFFGRKYNSFTVKSLIIFSVICSAFFTITSGVLGFRKEQDRMKVFANRLAVDRDLGLEIYLKSVEESIASDPLTAALAELDRSDQAILNRLSESYLRRVLQDYDISATLCRAFEQECFAKYDRRILSGVQISDNSRFIYTYDPNGRSGYLGVFHYYSKDKGLIRMYLDIEPKVNREDRGYYSILGKYSKPEDINIPNYYSYAKYVSNRLVFDKGNYAYPTIIYKDRLNHADRNGVEKKTVRSNGYVHFITPVSEDEFIIISRKTRSVMTYAVTYSYLLFIFFAMMYVLSYRRRGPSRQDLIFKRNYFRFGINAVLFCSMFLILVSMTVLSVTFAYKRNESNLYNMMSGKICTLQAMIENHCRHIGSTSELNSQKFSNIIESIGNDTKSDITIFTPSGKVLTSTTPEVFEKMVIGFRINGDAYYNIKYRNQRFYIHEEKILNKVFYSLYAPIINAEGNMVAIIGVPYTAENFDFKQDALFHAATIINLFLILIVITLVVSTSVVDSMFKPLIEMGQKMNQADRHGLEYIIYKRKDEISIIVDAYNRMVHDLSVSTKKLAQTERDKAWSEMARQVAHEIKNPLTPIKLEIQRLIRLKQRKDPSWEEKFDKVAAIVLEHIDILTDTANEFSTFAKLYSEEPVVVNLDSTLRDQLVIFDNKDDIRITYFGLEGAEVLAPRPQLIRVFVNLITNAIQAVEIKQKEAQENGEEPKPGKIIISLRKGVREGFYDIVFEDSGQGVSEENQGKLFTPNFTTKSGGTGLGLAICRNIIEKCNGEIVYRKSFALGGASFTVSLPERGNQ